MFTASAPDSQALQRSPGRAQGHHSAVDDSLGAGEVGIKNNRIVLTLFITSSECAVSHSLQNINTLNGHSRGTEIVLTCICLQCKFLPPLCIFSLHQTSVSETVLGGHILTVLVSQLLILCGSQLLSFFPNLLIFILTVSGQMFSWNPLWLFSKLP